MRVLPVLLAALLPLSVPLAAADAARCITLPDGALACGEVMAGYCGQGAATGQSTRPVTWRLAVITNHGNAYDEAHGTSVALAASAPCWTDTCTTLLLYADGHLVVQSETVC